VSAGQEARGAEPLEEQAQGARPQQANIPGKGLGEKAPVVTSPAGSRHQRHYLGRGVSCSCIPQK
jgi:hypothetical protein